MDATKSSSRLFLLVLMRFSTLLSAENLTVIPAKCFLDGNSAETLDWRYHSEMLKEKHFDKNFVFFHDGMKLENEGGGATTVYTGEAFVNYELTVKKPGSYIGKVDSINTTALVYTVKSEANTTSAARSGSDLNLTCVGGPEETVKLWEVDGVPVDEVKYRENNDGSLTMLKIGLKDALRRISCVMFFTDDDREEYKKNKSNVPGYKTAVVNTPVLVYNTSRHSESQSLFILQVACLKDGITVCGQKNSSDFCEKIGVNLSSVELDRDSNFTIYMNQTLLVTDHFKVSDELVHIKQPQDSDGAIVGIVAGVVIAAGVAIVAIVIFILRNHLNKEKKNHPSPDGTGDEHNRTSDPLVEQEKLDNNPEATDTEQEKLDNNPNATHEEVRAFFTKVSGKTHLA